MGAIEKPAVKKKGSASSKKDIPPKVNVEAVKKKQPDRNLLLFKKHVKETKNLGV